ncbi:imidazolonepropionase [bacterium]|nr:imidazolonepropionase [bacterium]
MKSADLVVSNCNQLLTCRSSLPKRKKDLQDLQILEKGCIASYKGRIIFIGHERELNKEVTLEKNGLWINGKGLTAVPGLVDSHTHLPFGGSREEEFLLRLNGYTYQQLAQKGMGIKSTVESTRKIPENELFELCLSRLDSMLRHGSTTVEAKSGYGLNEKDEIKQLKVLKALHRAHPVDIVSTFMGAHEVPREFKSKKREYMNLLIQRILPQIKKNNLAEFFDIFCEQGVYSLEETRELVKAAQKAGFPIKIHTDEFVPLGGTNLAVKEKAVSAEHLIAITQKGIDLISKSNTVATLLPAVPFFLMQEKKPPARQLIENGAIVALASDFNPGSSMTESMFFVIQLAVFTLKMRIEEAINAATINAAYAIKREQEIGSLELGKKMDLLLCEVPNYAHLVYHMGINPVQHVIKNGKLVVQDRLLVRDPKESHT